MKKISAPREPRFAVFSGESRLLSFGALDPTLRPQAPGGAKHSNPSEQNEMSKSTLVAAAKILAVFAAAAAFQRHVMPVPVVGAYLPK